MGDSVDNRLKVKGVGGFVIKEHVSKFN